MLSRRRRWRTPPPIKISPALRRKLEKAGLSAADVTGTGHDGRILKEDIDRAVASAASDPGASGKALSPTQSRVAQTLVGAQNTVPLFHLQRRLDVGPAIAALKRENPNLKSVITLLLIKGLRAALARHPELNVEFQGDTDTSRPNIQCCLGRFSLRWRGILRQWLATSPTKPFHS
jgi:pyruvate/2-oxoglutarate dehydrogenase complex dihydrolipoamide acyltransferase (E2) component